MIVECVPNFSEGKDKALIQAVVDAAKAVAGVVILDIESDADHNRCGIENTEGWEKDDLLEASMVDVVRRIQESNSWGTIGGRLREHILATLRPRLNYRDVLRQFRASILSTRRRLTRMKPNRRYGFLQMGSRYDFCTRLLFAVDVSGSMASDVPTRAA